MTERIREGDDETFETLRKLRDLIPAPPQAHGLVMLLGAGMAEALAEVRARQASLEVARAEARGSGAVEFRKAEAEAAEDAVSVLRSEVRRLRVSEPPADEHTVGVYGHVVDDGEPVVGAQVALLDEGRALACVVTDKAGVFALSQKSERPLSLRVCVADKVVHLDDEATLRPGPVATYRLVDLGEASIPPEKQYPCDGERPNPNDPPVKPGTSLIETLTMLRATGATLARVRVSPSEEATPQVVDTREGDGGLWLSVRGRTSNAGLLTVVAAVLAYQPEAEKMGIRSATAAAALLKRGGVGTWDEAGKLAQASPEELTRLFGLGRGEGLLLSQALRQTLQIIEVVEEG